MKSLKIVVGALAISSLMLTGTAFANCKAEKRALKQANKAEGRAAKSHAKADGRANKQRSRADQVAQKLIDIDNKTTAQCNNVNTRGQVRVDRAENKRIILVAKQADLAIELASCLFLGGNCQGIENKISRLLVQIARMETNIDQIENRTAQQYSACIQRKNARVGSFTEKANRAEQTAVDAEALVPPLLAALQAKQAETAAADAALQACLAS